MTAPPDENTCSVCGVVGDSHIQHRAVKTNELKRVLCVSCDRAARLNAWSSDGRLRTSLMIDSVLERHPQRPECALINASVDRIQTSVDEFNTAVFHGGLKQIIRECNTHGMSSSSATASSIGPVNVLVYAMAGRVMITLDAPAHCITLITTDEPPLRGRHRMGIQGIDATEAAATELLRATIDAWKAKSLRFTADAEVGMAL